MSDKQTPLVINIGSAEVEEPGNTLSRYMAEVFGYYTASDKRSPTGLPHATYAGYHYYLITGSKDSRLLKAKTEEELDVKSRHTWVNVDNLDDLLYQNLVANLATKPLVKQMVPKRTVVVWTEPGRKLRAAEKRWLKVVQRYIDTM